MGTESGDDLEEGSNSENVTLLPNSVNDGPVSKRATSSNKSEDSNSARKMKRLRRKKQGDSNSPLVKYGSLCLLVAQLVSLFIGHKIIFLFTFFTFPDSSRVL